MLQTEQPTGDLALARMQIFETREPKPLVSQDGRPPKISRPPREAPDCQAETGSTYYTELSQSRPEHKPIEDLTKKEAHYNKTYDEVTAWRTLNLGPKLLLKYGTALQQICWLCGLGSAIEVSRGGSHR